MLNALIVSGREAALAQAVSSSPVFPPSFDGSPLMFGWALCSRLLIFSLSAALIVRVMSRMQQHDAASDHTTLCVRLVLLSFFWAFLFGSSSDVITWLAWGEVSSDAMSQIMAFSRVLDGLSAVPFFLGLNVPLWAFVMVRLGLAHESRDAPLWPPQVPWGPLAAPISVSAWCLVASIGVTLAKWMTWHGAHAVG